MPGRPAEFAEHSEVSWHTKSILSTAAHQPEQEAQFISLGGAVWLLPVQTSAAVYMKGMFLQH